MTDAPTIGVVGSADVANALRSIGFLVVTGSDFRQTATEISELLKNGRSFPVVVADSANTTALGAWTIKASELTHLVVLGTKPGIDLLAGSSQRLELPATVNELLSMLRYQVTPRPVGSQVIGLDGTVNEPRVVEPKHLPAPLPLPGVSDDEIDESSPVAMLTEPAETRPDAGSPGLTQGFPDDLFLTSGGLPSPRPGGQAESVAVPERPIERPPLVLPALARREERGAGETRADDHFTPQENLPVVPQEQVQVSASAAPTELAPSVTIAEGEPLVRTAPAPEQQQPWQSQRMPASPAPHSQVIVEREVQPKLEPSPQIVGDDDLDFFTRRAQRSQADSTSKRMSPSPVSTHAEVVVTAAGRGGVGKTTTAILQGQIAAASGLRAVVIDGNRGQADLRKYLRLGNAPLRSAYDAALSGNPADAVLTPQDYAPYRLANRLDVPDFAIVLGPPSDHAGPDDVSAGVYRGIVDYCRTIADIVIVDTQIMESHRTDLWDHFVIPLLRDDAWLVAITDESTPGVSNLADRLEELHRQGVTNARTMILATMYRNFSDEDAAYVQHKFGPYGSLIGSTGEDQRFHEDINLGRIYAESPEIAPAMKAILRQVTGRTDLFSPPEPERKRRGLFSFRGGRR